MVMFYYIVYGLLYGISLLPFRILYIISDAASFLLYHVIRYRRDIVANNLLIAFPEKTAAERKRIAKQFYKDFVDNFIEVIKMISISKKELDKRFVGNYQLMNDLYQTGKNVQVHLGHYFNWEYANLAYTANQLYPFIVVYQPISNKVLDRIFYKMRSRFGTKLVPVNNFRNEFAQLSKGKYALILVGDQNPPGPENAYWTDFFGRKTPFVKGPEKGARLKNTAIVMCNIYKVKRGYYRSELRLLTTEPRTLADGVITKEMITFIEDTVRTYPSNYLWSHRRWKWEYDPEKFGHLVVQ